MRGGVVSSVVWLLKKYLQGLPNDEATHGVSNEGDLQGPRLRLVQQSRIEKLIYLLSHPRAHLGDAIQIPGFD